MREHNLTPAQVRDHARALILAAVEDVLDDTMGIGESLEGKIPTGVGVAAWDATVTDVEHAIRTARIKVTWKVEPHRCSCSVCTPDPEEDAPR